MSGSRGNSFWRIAVPVLLSLFLIAGAVSVHAQSVESLYSKAVGKYIEGDYRGSFELLQTVLEKDPDNDSAKRLLPEVKKELPASYLRQQGGEPARSETRKKQQPPAETEPDTPRRTPADTSVRSQPRPTGDDRPADTETTTQPSPETDTYTQSSPDRDQASLKESKYPDFKPLDQSQREEGPLAPPEISEEPRNVIRHVNEDYSTAKGREKVVYGVVAREYEDRIRFEVKSTGPVGYIGSRIFNPPMVIVDLPNTVDGLPDSPLPIDLNKIVRIRHSQYRIDPIRTTRLVLDLEKWNDRYRLYRDPEGRGAVIDVFRAGAKMPPETPEVHRVDDGSSSMRVSSPLANLEKVRGDKQSIGLNSEAPRDLTLRLTDSGGDPIGGETVVYTLSRGQGTIMTQGRRSNQRLRTYTDGSGFARLSYRSDTQAGRTVVRADVPSKNVSVTFQVRVKPGEAVELVKVSGDRQATLYGQSVPKPLVVEARDSYGNPVPGVQLKFEDLTGKGLLDLSSGTEGIQVRGRTDKDGRLKVDHYRIASDVEKNRVRVQAYRDPSDPMQATFLVFGQPQLITIDFKSANLQDVLRTLAQIANWNIALTETAAGQNLNQMSVTVHLEQVTALRALDTILDVKGLSRVSDGNVMKIVAKEEAIRKGVSVISPEELSDYPANNIVTVAYKLRFLEANQQLAQQFQTSLLAENSSIVADQSSNSLIVTDLANNLRRLKRIIRTIDRPNRLYDVRVFKLKKRDPQALEESITELLPTGQGNVVPHRATNTLLVYADPSLMDRIEKIVNSLDTRNILAKNMEVIDVEGYDATELANRINTILGVQVIPVDQLSFDIEESADLSEILSGVEEVNIGALVNSAKILPLTNLEKIIVFGPQNIRSAAQKLVDDLKQSPGKYIDDRSWAWVSFDVMPFEKAQTMIQKTGGIKVQVALEDQNAFLLSSQSEDDIQKISQFLEGIEEKYDADAPVGVYRLKHIQLTTEEAVDDFEQSVDALMEGLVPDADVGFVINGYGQTVSYSTERNRMSDLRAAVASLDTSAYEFSQGELMTYTPKYIGTGQIASFITTQDLGTVISQQDIGGGKVVFIPKEDRSLVRERIRTFDSTKRKTFSYDLKHREANNDFQQRLSQITSQLNINAVYTVDPGSNKIFFTTLPSNRKHIQSLIAAQDEPGELRKKVLLNFSPTYVNPTNLTETVQQQNLGQVVYASEQENKLTLLVTEGRKEKIRKILNKIDDPTQSFNVIHLQRRQASSDLIDNLQSVLNDLGINAQLAADQKTNSILYAAPSTSDDQVEKVIRRLDKWQKQVLIKAVLVEISLEEGQSLNPQWIANPGSVRNPFINENQFNQNSDAGVGYSLGAEGGDGGLTALLNAGDFLTVMRWIRENDRSDVVTRPVVTALNNQQARIDLSQQRFFQVANFDDEGNVVATTFEPQSADKTLQVTPTITNNSNIIMDVRIANDVFGNRPGPAAPFPVNRRVTQNQVMVNDGQTIVLGGFIQSNETRNVEKVPYISQLPFLGNLFRSISEDTVRTELVVFLTPHVMETPGDMTEGANRTLRDMDNIDRPEEMTGQYTPPADGQQNVQDTPARSTESLRVDRQRATDPGERANLNTIDRTSLGDGIGHTFARRIVDERSQNGFFESWGNLQNRLNFTSEEIKELQKAYSISVPVLNVNEVSQERLAMLPGLTDELAGNIVDYRFRSGNFRSLEGLYQVFGVDEQVFSSIEPYLTVE